MLNAWLGYFLESFRIVQVESAQMSLYPPEQLS